MGGGTFFKVEGARACQKTVENFCFFKLANVTSQAL